MNAGASTFVPGGAAANEPGYYDDPCYHHDGDEDDEEEEIMDALEAEMHHDEMDLLAAGLGDPQVSSPAPTAAATALPAHMAGHAAEFWFPECRDCACCRGYKHGCSCGGLCRCSGGTAGAAASPAGGSSPPKKTPCRFFQQGTCKFGDKCRFAHSL